MFSNIGNRLAHLVMGNRAALEKRFGKKTHRAFENVYFVDLKTTQAGVYQKTTYSDLPQYQSALDGLADCIASSGHGAILSGGAGIPGVTTPCTPCHPRRPYEHPARLSRMYTSARTWRAAVGEPRTTDIYSLAIVLRF